ncbi:MAG: GNAT family N-acetyltransferase [Candidatus Thorarchaeota archaeon]
MRKSKSRNLEALLKCRHVRKEMYLDHNLLEINSRFSEISTELHYKHASSPHWFLSTIAVDEAFQGKGSASKLIRIKLEQGNTQNLKCYLNTENEKYIPLYEHFGFELVEQKQAPNSNLMVHGMLKG